MSTVQPGADHDDRAPFFSSAARHPEKAAILNPDRSFFGDLAATNLFVDSAGIQYKKDGCSVYDGL